MGVAHRLVVAALAMAPAACSGSDEPEAVAPVVCSSDAPFRLGDDPTPSQAQVLDVQVGTGLDEAAATRRARMENIAMLVREELELEDPGHLGLRVDDGGEGLVYLTTETELACQRLEDVMGGAADGIAVVTAARSQAETIELLETVQGALAGAPQGLVRMVRIDAETELVLVQVPIGGGDEVEDLLAELPDEVEELVVVEETDRLPTEGG